MSKTFIILTLLAVIFIFTNRAHSRDWSDLEEGEHSIYGSEKEAKYPVNLFFVEKENWENHYSLSIFWLFNDTDYPKYKSFRFLPFYYNLKSKIDNREKTVIPLLLWYNRIGGNSELLVTPLYYSSIESNESDRSIFYLFWWGKSGTGYLKTYKFFVPIVFYQSDGRSTDNRRTEFFIASPLFIYKSRINEQAKYSSTLNLSLLHYYSSQINSNERTTTWWFPLIPVTFHHTSPAGGHRNFFWVLLDYSWKRDRAGDTMERFWLTPFWLWKAGDNGYNHILPPLFIHSRSSTGESYTHLLPFFMHSKNSEFNYDNSGANIYNTETSISLFHYHSSTYPGKNKWEGSPDKKTAWYPLIPLYYYHRDSNKGAHRNFLWVFDWHVNKENELDRFWFIPVWFYRNGQAGYAHILPPLFMSFRSGSGGYYRHFLPLFFSWKTAEQAEHANIYSGQRDSGGYSEALITPFYCYVDKYKDTIEQKNDLYSTALWLPVLPLLYRSNHKEEGSHTNLIGIFDWRSSKEGSLDRFWFIPLAFHQSGDAGYRYYFPFYFRPAGNTEEKGMSLGLFHFHEWSREQRVMWIGPCYVQYNPAKKEHFGLLLPFYISWRSQKSKGEVLLPWSISYEDKKRSLYLNIFGISKSAVLGPLNPDISLSAGTYKGKWYLDTDVSWLYDVFSFSTRVSLKNPWSGEGEGSTDAGLKESDNLEEAFADDFKKSGQTGKPSLQKHSALSRDNSEFFWGYKLLFGWFAYERGDTKRHLRLIPLGWFTWDKESDDKLYTVPFAFLSYKSDELEYFVLFPLFIPIYGHQKEKDSYAKGYLINLYWDEYNAEEKLREQTILWPLINLYSSPERHGSRFFPVFWHKESVKDGISYSKNIILPLLFYSKHERDKDENLLKKFVINPLYYSSRTTDTREISETTMLPIVPLLYYSSFNKTIYSFENNPDGPDGEKSAASGKVKSIAYERTNILPILYFSWNKITVMEDNREEKNSSFFLLGYYSGFTPREKRSSLLFGLISSKRDLAKNSSETSLLYGLFAYSSGMETRSYFIPLYYYYSSPLETHWNFLIFVDGKSSDNYKRFFMFPLWYTSYEDGRSHTNIIGLIDWKSDSKGELVRSLFLPFYIWYQDEMSNLFVFPPLMYFGRSAKEETTFIAGLYFHSSESYERQNLLFLFDHKRYKTYDRDSYNFLLGTIHYATSPEKIEWDVAFGIFAKYKGYKNSENYQFDFLLFMSNWKRDGDYRRSSIMPLWYYQENADKWSLLSPIALSYFSKDKYSDFDMGLLGLVYYRNNDIPEKTDVRTLLCGILYYEKRKPERGYHSVGSLWGILWDYETESETGFEKISILKIPVYKKGTN